jgi:CDP-diglyceride synthetase
VPQIRFSGREGSSDLIVMRTEVSAPRVFPSSSSPESVYSADSSPSYVRGDSEPIARRAGGLNRQAALRSALNAGAIAAVLCLLPLGFLVAMPMAGYFGIRFYGRRSLAQELSPAGGFKLGSLCGAFGSAIFVVLALALTFASHAQNEFRDRMIEMVRHAQVSYPAPQARQLDYFASPQGLIVMLVTTALFFCVAFVLLSGLGGAISAALLRKKGPRR